MINVYSKVRLRTSDSWPRGGGFDSKLIGLCGDFSGSNATCAETWTMTKADRERLEAIKMWFWRRMDKISWVDKVINVEVLQKMEENWSTLNSVSMTEKTQMDWTHFEAWIFVPWYTGAVLRWGSGAHAGWVPPPRFTVAPKIQKLAGKIFKRFKMLHIR